MRLRRAGAIAVAGLALAAVAPAQLAMAAGARPAAARTVSGSLPYTDPNQVGTLTLCNTQDQPITHGSITAKPFVWRVVSSEPTPQGYWVKGATAQLFAYRAQRQVSPYNWSGQVLAGASEYSNPAHPMAQFTPIDEPFTYMTVTFPAMWDGLYQLRLYLGGPYLEEYEQTYPAADIRVTGNTWTLVSGGHASCTTGTAVSREAMLGLPGANSSPSASASASASSSAAAGATSSAGASSSAGTASAALASHSGSGAGLLLASSGAVAVVLLATGGVWWIRRRRAST
jgi:hypothetical protein